MSGPTVLHPIGASYKKVLLKIVTLFEIFVMPAILLSCYFHPNVFNGMVDYFEAGEHLVVVNEIFNHGALYRDINFFHGPLCYYGPAILMKFLGSNLLYLRVIFFAGWILGFLAIYFTGRLLIKRRVIFYLFVWIVFSKCWDAYWCTRWGGGLRICWAFMAILATLLFCKYRKIFYLSLAGFFSALCFFSNYDQGTMLLFSTALFFASNHWFCKGSDQESDRRLIGAYAFGAGVMIVCIFFVFFQSHSLILFFQELSMIGKRAKLLSFQIERDNLPRVLLMGAFYPLFFLFFLRRWRTIPYANFIFSLAVYGVLVYLYAFRYIKGVQLKPVFAIFCVLFFYWIDLLIGMIPDDKKRGRLLRSGFTVILPLIFGNYLWRGQEIPQNNMYQETISNLRAVDPEIKKMKGVLVPAWQAQEIEELYRFIKKNSSPNELLLCFPSAAFFHFICDRLSPSRFYVNFLAFSKKDWAFEFLRAVKQNPPEIILLSYGSIGVKQLASGYGVLGPLFRFIRKNYSLVGRTTTGRFDFYVRKH